MWVEICVLEASTNPFLSISKKYFVLFCFFKGGNQRDLARDKAAKKAADLQKSKSAAEKEGNKGLSLEARKQRYAHTTHPLNILMLILSHCNRRDADLMREKQKLKDLKAAEAAAKKWNDQIDSLWAVHKGLNTV